MKTNFKKIAVIFSLVVVMIAALALVVAAEKADFTPPAEYSDITPANGWVQIGTKTGADTVDDDGKDVALYYINGANAYLNKATKTLVYVGNTSLTGNYGDWLEREDKCNVPGQKYFLIYWGSLNSEMVEHIEFRNCAAFNNGGYVLQTFKHVKSVKLATTANGTSGTKSDTGLFNSMVSLETVGHGTWDETGKWTPVSYTEGVVDMTGFTYLKPLTGNGDNKAALYAGSMFLSCESIKEVIMPKTFGYSGSYTPAVDEGGKWVKGPAAIESKDDEFGGEYAGVFAKNMFKNASMLTKITLPEGVELKAFEKDALNGCSILRCIDVKGTVSSSLKIESGAFNGIAGGCIIRCARAEDVALVNQLLADNNITNVKATDMSVEPTPAPKVTKLPTAPKWVEFNPETAGATAYGSMKATYTDNWWAYFQDTKTLKFFAKKNSGYNEVGSLGQCEDGAGWTVYKEEIEHVVIGPAIHKLTATFALGMTNLQDIEMTSNISQASGAFEDNLKLTTIFITGMEKVEGQAMFAGAKTNFKLNLSGTAVKSIHMGSSAWAYIGNIVAGPKTSTLIFDAPSEAVIAYCQENYLNIKDSNDKSYGEWYVEVPEGLPFCGDTAVFDFDEATGTLYIKGKGTISDVANYWGGGSKNQHWFSIRDNIKHVVVGDYITAIGKYAFTECKNIETIELPAKDGFVILNAAFEDCYNLKSVYIRGNQPIEGTADVSILHEFESYMFADCFLIANAVINENVKKIGVSVFDNCVNLQNIYGVPGSYAEEYATKNEFTFFDKSANTPQPITCTPPSDETTADTALDTTPDTTPVGGDDDQTTDDGGNSMLPIIIIVAAVVVVAVVVVVVIIAKKKSAKKD